jgi:hypothetical protein
MFPPRLRHQAHNGRSIPCSHPNRPYRRSSGVGETDASVRKKVRVEDKTRVKSHAQVDRTAMAITRSVVLSIVVGLAAFVVTTIWAGELSETLQNTKRRLIDGIAQMRLSCSRAQSLAMLLPKEEIRWIRCRVYWTLNSL